MRIKVREMLEHNVNSKVSSSLFIKSEKEWDDECSLL
jgi:hypothetical protein